MHLSAKMTTAIRPRTHEQLKLKKTNAFQGRTFIRLSTCNFNVRSFTAFRLFSPFLGSPGFYEFRLCDESQETQACFDKHLLTIVGHDGGPNSTAMSVPQTQGLNIIHLQLPVGVKCEYCTLQWRFRKGEVLK